MTDKGDYYRPTRVNPGPKLEKTNGWSLRYLKTDHGGTDQRRTDHGQTDGQR